MGVFAWFLSTCVEVAGCASCVCGCFRWVEGAGSHVAGCAFAGFPRVIIA